MIMMILFMVFLMCIVGKMIYLAFRLTWGFTKVFLNIFLLPFLLAALVLRGIMFIAWPLLIVFALMALFARRV